MLELYNITFSSKSGPFNSSQNKLIRFSFSISFYIQRIILSFRIMQEKILTNRLLSGRNKLELPKYTISQSILRSIINIQQVKGHRNLRSQAMVVLSYEKTSLKENAKYFRPNNQTKLLVICHSNIKKPQTNYQQIINREQRRKLKFLFLVIFLLFSQRSCLEA